MTPLSQRDPRWKDVKIGNSDSTIGGYGCTITCLSMQAGLTPDEFNTKMTAVGGYQVDRVLWQKVNEAVSWLRFPDNGRQYAYDNDAVKAAIEKYGSCLVEVDFDGITSTPNDRHWVLYTGNQRCIDPWTGNDVLTSKYPVRKGYCVIEVSAKPEDKPAENTTSQDQQNVLKFLAKQNANEGKVREAFGALAEKPDMAKQIVEMTANQALTIQFLEDVGKLLGCPPNKTDIIFAINQALALNNKTITLDLQLTDLKKSFDTRVKEEADKANFTLVLENKKLSNEIDRLKKVVSDRDGTIATLRSKADPNRKTILDLLYKLLRV